MEYQAREDVSSWDVRPSRRPTAHGPRASKISSCHTCDRVCVCNKRDLFTERVESKQRVREKNCPVPNPDFVQSQLQGGIDEFIH